MFGGGGSGDPFGNPFEHMHRQMRQMDNMMNAMLGDAFDMLNNFGMMGPPIPQHPMLTEDSNRYPPAHRRQQQRYNNDMMMSPFGGFGFGGPLFGGMMQQMHNLHDRALDDPNSVVFSESTMVSYDGSGQPKVVQHSTRKAGDVKETRKSLRDGQNEEMTIGHSIGDRAHIIEKKRDKDGKMRQQQKFINLEQGEAEEFNRQFKGRARDNLSGLFNGGSYNHRQNAIENGKYNGKGRGGVGSSYHHNSGGSSNATPIITVPEDDEDDEPTRRSRGRRGGGGRYDEDVVYSNNGVGPTIQEIDDDEADSANPKRRKGVFGKFLG